MAGPIDPSSGVKRFQIEGEDGSLSFRPIEREGVEDSALDTQLQDLGSSSPIHRDEFDEQAEILALKERVAEADFEISVLNEVEARLSKSDLQKQTILRRLYRAIDISDPEIGLLPSKYFDRSKEQSMSNLHDLLTTATFCYAFIGLPYLTAKFLGGYIPGPWLIDAAAGIGALFASALLSKHESFIPKAIGNTACFILTAPLGLPLMAIQGVKSVFGAFAGAVGGESEVEEAAESKLESMLAPIRSQKLKENQRWAARKDLLTAVRNKREELHAGIEPDRHKLEDMLEEETRRTEVEASLRRLEQERIDKARISSALEQAKDVLGSSSGRNGEPSQKIHRQEASIQTPLFSDLARLSPQELSALYDALDNDVEFCSLAASGSSLVRNLVSDIVGFHGEELRVAKEHLRSALTSHLEVFGN